MANIWVVFGGELKTLNVPPQTVVDLSIFRDPKAVEFVGTFDNAQAAGDAWRSRAQSTVDNALMRFFVVPYDTTTLPPLSGDPREPADPISRLAADVRRGAFRCEEA